MAATINIVMTPTEQVEYNIIDTLQSLTVAEHAADRLSAEQSFDVGCALQGAREALNRALAMIAQAQPQARRLAA